MTIERTMRRSRNELDVLAATTRRPRWREHHAPARPTGRPDGVPGIPAAGLGSMLVCGLLLAGCGSVDVRHPSVQHLPAAQVVTLVPDDATTSGSIRIIRVRDSSGAEVISHDWQTKKSVVLAPGRYDVDLSCSSGTRLALPWLRIDAQAGQTYQFYCLMDHARASARVRSKATEP